MSPALPAKREFSDKDEGGKAWKESGNEGRKQAGRQGQWKQGCLGCEVGKKGKQAGDAAVGRRGGRWKD